MDKTPDEIKKGLECCSILTADCESNCPYFMVEGCIKQCNDDALAYIQHLESRLAQVERERDAMKRDFMIDGCEACKHGHSALDDCNVPWSPCKWEWRGVCAENTKEDLDA